MICCELGRGHCERPSQELSTSEPFGKRVVPEGHSRKRPLPSTSKSYFVCDGTSGRGAGGGGRVLARGPSNTIASHACLDVPVVQAVSEGHEGQPGQAAAERARCDGAERRSCVSRSDLAARSAAHRARCAPPTRRARSRRTWQVGRAPAMARAGSDGRAGTDASRPTHRPLLRERQHQGLERAARNPHDVRQASHKRPAARTQ